jgi:potassium channel subfamily K, other eukaryote
MTVLIQEMSRTIVAAVNSGTNALADWTVMPKKGVVKDFLDSHPKVRAWVQAFIDRQQLKRRLKSGFKIQGPDENGNLEPDGKDQTAEEVAEETEKNLELLVKQVESEHDLVKQLAIAIRKVAHDLHIQPPIRYNYEQWVHFTKLIRFSRRTKEEIELIEEEEGLVEWDWIGEDSPMLADESESQWVLDRLCESLNRYTRKQAAKVCDTQAPQS